MLAAIYTTSLGAQASEPSTLDAPLPSRLRSTGASPSTAGSTRPRGPTRRAVTEFTQLDPDEGQPASERTEVRIVYDDEALYVGARPARQRPRRRAASCGATRMVLDSDWLSVALDSYHDHLSAYRFA